MKGEILNHLLMGDLIYKLNLSFKLTNEFNSTTHQCGTSLHLNNLFPVGTY